MDTTDLISVPNWWWVVGWELFLGTVAFSIWRLIGYSRFNAFSLFFPMVLLTNGLLLPFSRNINQVISGLDIGDPAFSRYTIGVSLFYLGLPIGILAANSFWRNNHRFHSAENLCRWPTGTSIFLVCVCVLSAAYLGIIIQDGLFLNPLIFVHGFGSYENYAAYRYDFAAATGGARYFLYNKLPYAIAPMAVILLWNWRRPPLMVRLAALGLISLVLLQTGHKLPLVFLLCVCLVSALALKNNLVVSFRMAALGLGLFVLILFLIVPYFYLSQGVQDYSVALWWSFERIFGESYRGLQLYFYTYPDFHPYLMGTSQRTIAALAGVQDYLPTSIYIPRVMLEQENTSYPSLFISDAWADFGYSGVLFFSAICGYLLQMYNRWYFRKPTRGLEESALLLAVALSAPHLLYCNLLTAFSTYGLGVFAVIFLLIRQLHDQKSVQQNVVLLNK